MSEKLPKNNLTPAEKAKLWFKAYVIAFPHILWIQTDQGPAFAKEVLQTSAAPKDIDPLITAITQTDEQGRVIGQPLDPDKTASWLKKLRQATQS